MTLEIRPVTPDNLSTAIELAVDIFGENQRMAIQIELKGSLEIAPECEIARNEYHLGDMKYFMAFKDGVPAGLTGYYDIDDHPEDIWLGWTGVRPQFEGQGIGRLLVEHAFESAPKECVSTWRIWTTLQTKYEGARHLYAKMGFVEEIYEPNAMDAGNLIAVLSKPTKADTPFESYAWESHGYPIDAEGYEIPYLNDKMGLEDDKNGLKEKKAATKTPKPAANENSASGTPKQNKKRVSGPGGPGC